MHASRERADTRVESSRGCVYGRRKRTRTSLNSKKERRRSIELLRRRAVCDTDDDERRDDDEIGTFFDARTRDAHFRFEAHAREPRIRRLVDSAQNECLPRARLARLFSPSRGSSVRRQRKYTHKCPARRRRRPRDARDPFRHRREMRNEKETPPNSRLSRLRLVDSTF